MNAAYSKRLMELHSNPPILHVMMYTMVLMGDTQFVFDSPTTEDALGAGFLDNFGLKKRKKV